MEPVVSAIELDQITRVFGTTPVLNGINLRVEVGAFVAILGRSGSGKSTLLRIVAGLDKASGGAARASDSIAMAFQEARLALAQRG
jgi:sulfonate transport system ATP-binding protein